MFGCPKNRSIPEGGDIEVAVRFFRTLGDYASTHNIVVALEANPPIYNTNFINTTKEAIKLVELVSSKGFMLNVDVGTMIENNESISVLEGKGHLISHVHISESGLKPIQKRGIHQELAAMLRQIGYERFVSVEVGRQDNICILEKTMKYIEGVFMR